MMLAQQRALDRLREDRRRTPAGMVHHYTNKQGLEGITNSGTLWLSDYTTMPDSGEIEYGYSIGWQVLREEYENSPKTGRIRRFVEVTESIGKRGLGHFFRGFILSMTPNGDVVHQWRDYSESAEGFCLGFNGRKLDRAFKVFTKEYGVEASGSFEVLHDEKLLRRLMRKYVRNALNAVMWLCDKGGYRKAAARAMAETGVQLMFAIIFTALFFKHPAYAAEREYRYIVMALPHRKIASLRSRKDWWGRKVEYFAFDWKSVQPGALELVKIGPGQKEAKGRKIISKALNRAGLSANITMSEMPAIRRRPRKRA